VNRVCEDTIQLIQLETTSRCTLNCATCLKAEYHNSWQEREMGRRLFDCILSEIKAFKPLVHLQGWGDPLSHPEILFYIQQLKAEGLTVNFTTNGSLINSFIAESLLDCKLDGLTFSMAGIGSGSQDLLRGVGTSEAVKNAIKIVTEAKENRQSTVPALAVSYLITPGTVRDLPAAVSWCRNNGIDSFVSVHLTQAGGQKQQDLQYFKWGKRSRYDLFLRVHAHARSLFGKMRLQLKPFHPILTAVCDKNPLNSLFISAKGDVSPCVFLCPPVEHGINWRYKGLNHYQKPFIFGNIQDAGLDEIWACREYKEFRRKFRVRADYHDRKLVKVSYSLSGSAELESAVRAIRSYFSSHSPPGECAACAKLDGY